MIDLIVRSGAVITMDRSRGVLIDGAVGVDGGEIVDIGPGDEGVAAFTTRAVVERPAGAIVHGQPDRSLP